MAWSSAGSGEPVIFRYPQRFDTFHHPIDGSGRDVPVEDCVLAPSGGRENDAQAEQVVTDAELYCPPDVPRITAQDQVVVRGEVYDLVAAPRYWLNETVILTLKRVTG
jgi:hypothetical protein